jgi:hypothetical protein
MESNTGENATEKVLNSIFEKTIFEKTIFEKLEKEENYPYIRKLLRYYHEDVRKKPRYLYDGDAVYFYNYDESIKEIENEARKKYLSERGDVMMSFWMPFTYCYWGKKKSKNNKNLDEILKRLNEEEPQILKVCGNMEFLSEDYWSRGNLLLLPNSVNKNNRRCLNSDRGTQFEDKIDQTLWHCFEGGKLFEYFSNKENVEKWILSERLECIFSEKFFELSLNDILNKDIKIQNICICQGNL